jgi:branched-chain amino acid transport system substrate-binding protein
MLPVAEEYKKILLVDQAVADSITGAAWNRYVFRTARSSMQDAVSNAVVIGKPDTVIGTLAPDYVFGKDAVKAFKDALAGTGAKIVHEEYVPVGATDYTAPAERLFNALKGRSERKVIYVVPVAGNPFKIAELNPQRHGIELAASGHTLDGLVAYKQVPGLEGATQYYYTAPKNPINDWFVAEHQKRYNSPPDFYTVGSMVAGIAIVEAIKKAGSTDTEKLIAAMEGMPFDTPKGRMTFRKEDHQAMQSMFHFKIRTDPAVAWGIPDLVREIKPEEMTIPVQVKR